jgi:hypothetical protein
MLQNRQKPIKTNNEQSRIRQQRETMYKAETAIKTNNEQGLNPPTEGTML